VETDKYNLRKSMLSINPNFIHRLDALLLNFVVLKAKANNIPLNCAHDSFTTFVVFEKQIKAYYYEAFVKFILKDEALQNFFDTNTNFKIEEEVQNHLDMFRLERFNILNKISSNELVMSNNILKP
jgi:DNA-directed RNA polymerase